MYFRIICVVWGKKVKPFLGSDVVYWEKWKWVEVGAFQVVAGGVNFGTFGRGALKGIDC